MAEITYEGNKYRFSTWSLVLFPIGTILLFFVLYYGTEAWFGKELHQFVAEQTAWLLNLFGVNVRVIPVVPPGTLDGRPVWWQFTGDIPYPIYFTHDCSGFQAIAIFLALILFIPHSQDTKANERIWQRKGLSMLVSSLLFHVVNVLRMVIQISLFHAGFDWEDIHYSISAASSIIAVVIIVLMNRWIPEFVLSIMVIGRRIGSAFKRPKENPISIGKIVNKELFLKCDLIPQSVKNTIESAGKYFLMIFVPRQDLVKASFYPRPDANISKILIKLRKFSPELVNDISVVFNKLQLTEHVIHTTGLCSSAEACFYESYAHLSSEGKISIETLKEAFSQVPEVLDVIITPVPEEKGTIESPSNQTSKKSLDFT